ncbi:hypothetical protein LTR15_004518 [Elasticomyces elasticus]|nr:hypothetical protein LTR15_004518 [Elasticomyces elasticus]
MADAEPFPKRAKVDFSESVRVLVGPSKKEFHVHVGALTRRSTFFKAAVAQRWTSEGQAKAVELPEDEPDVFSYYLQCLYFDTVCHDEMVNTSLLDQYILADKLGDLFSANTIINKIIRNSSETRSIPSATSVNYAYEKTTPNSPLRRLLVDFYVYRGHGDDICAAAEVVHAEFATALIREFVRIRPGRNNPDAFSIFQNAKHRPRCHYHQHDESCPPCVGD